MENSPTQNPRRHIWTIERGFFPLRDAEGNALPEGNQTATTETEVAPRRRIYTLEHGFFQPSNPEASATREGRTALELLATPAERILTRTAKILGGTVYGIGLLGLATAGLLLGIPDKIGNGIAKMLKSAGAAKWIEQTTPFSVDAYMDHSKAAKEKLIKWFSLPQRKAA